MEFGRRTNLHETTLSSYRTTPQARQARRPLRRRRSYGYHASPLSAKKSRRLRAPACSARAIADMVLMDRVPPIRLSRASRKRLYLHLALPLGFPHSVEPDPCSPMRPLMMRTSLSLLRPPSNLRLLIKVFAHPLLLPRGSSCHLLLSATLTHCPHRNRLLPSHGQLLQLPNLVSLRKWVPRGRKNCRHLPRLQ